MGIKHEFGEDGFDVADQWSQTGGSYDSSNFKSTWKHIHSGGGITIATVFKQAIDNGYKPESKEYTEEEKAMFRKQQKERAKKRTEEGAKEKAEREKWHNVIADFAVSVLKQFTISIKSNKYLTTKKVNAYGVYGFKSSFIVVIKPDFVTEIITGGKEIKQFFANLPDADSRDFSFLHIKRGDLAIPLIDIDKKVWNIQIINGTGTKLFLKNGRKSGCFHFIGKASSCNVMAVVEGYATGATIHMATEWPCAVALDAGNLVNVSKLLKQKLPDKDFIICADDDAGTKGNPGITKAKEAATAVDGIVAVPDFSIITNEKVA
jgi:putative DNA primase/helicase